MAEGIWVVAEQRDGKLKKASFEGLKAAKQIAADVGQPITAVLIGSAVLQLLFLWLHFTWSVSP